MTNHEDRVAPRTAAGEELRSQMPYWCNSAHSVDGEVVASILAIEAEAVKQGAAEGFVAGYGHAKAFYEAASLDSDELRKAVEALRGGLKDALRILDGGHRGYVGDHYIRTVQVNERSVDRLRALLSAGDKAKAPR